MGGKLEVLIDLSRSYGGNPDYVIAGGGNTSFKDGELMWVKASGNSLAGIDESGFVRMRLERLRDLWDAEYPADVAAREEMASKDLLECRDRGEEAKRPSVEALLHALFPEPLVIHTHPALVNGVTCSKDGERAVSDLFGNEALWVPTVNPGYILAKTVGNLYAAAEPKPRMVFLQNHGVFVTGEDADEIGDRYAYIESKIRSRVRREPDLTAVTVDPKTRGAVTDAFAGALADGQSVPSVSVRTVRQALDFAADRSSFAPLSGSYTPDHIVYCGPAAVYVDGAGDDAVERAVRGHRDTFGVSPRIAVVRGAGIFAAGSTRGAADIAADMFVDAVKVAVYTQSFGGPSFMPEDQVRFIANWEVEHYRKKVSTGE